MVLPLMPQTFLNIALHTSICLGPVVSCRLLRLRLELFTPTKVGDRFGQPGRLFHYVSLYSWVRLVSGPGLGGCKWEGYPIPTLATETPVSPVGIRWQEDMRTLLLGRTALRLLCLPGRAGKDPGVGPRTNRFIPHCKETLGAINS